MPFMLLVNQRMARPSCNEQGFKYSYTGRPNYEMDSYPPLYCNWSSIEFIVMGYSVKIKRYENLPDFQDKDKLSDYENVLKAPSCHLPLFTRLFFAM